MVLILRIALLCWGAVIAFPRLFADFTQCEKFAGVKGRLGNLVETRKNITQDENLYYAVIKFSLTRHETKGGQKAENVRKNINKKFVVCSSGKLRSNLSQMSRGSLQLARRNQDYSVDVHC